MQERAWNGTNEQFLFELEAASNEVLEKVNQSAAILKHIYGSWESIPGKHRNLLANQLRKGGYKFNPKNGWERRHNSVA